MYVCTTYVQRIGLRGLGVMPTVDIAHYEYHYLSSCACAENRAIAPLTIMYFVSPGLTLNVVVYIYVYYTKTFFVY